MSARLQVHDTRGGPAFELDRFGLVDGERYELEGRWSGVRGRLFIRPELTLSNGKQSRRLLADLAQKPWQTADGESWAVAFPCADGPIAATEVELTVAPDITVTVKRGRARKAPARTETEPGGRRRGLGVQLAEAQSELQQAREQTTHLADRLDAATRRAEEGRAEREHIAATRDALLAERNQAAAERDTANRLAAVDREAAQRTQDELDEARTALQQALATLDQTTAERDSAIHAGVEVERELHAAKTAREDLLREREQLIAQQHWLKGELKRLAAAHAADRDKPAPTARRNLAAARPVPLPAPNPDADWTLGGAGFSAGSAKHSRVAALAALTAAIVVVVLVLLLLVF